MSLEENKGLFRRWIEAWNTSKDERIDEFFTDTAVAHLPMPPPDEIRGLENVKQWHTAFARGFPGNQVTIEDMIAEGDRLVARCVFQGMQSGAMGDIPASNREVTLPFIVIFRIKNGKIAEFWEHFDTHGLLRQIGAV